MLKDTKLITFNEQFLEESKKVKVPKNVVAFFSRKQDFFPKVGLCHYCTLKLPQLHANYVSFQRHCFTVLVNCCRHLYME